MGFKSYKNYFILSRILINKPCPQLLDFFVVSYHTIIHHMIINRFFNSHHSFIINQIYQCLNRFLFCVSIKYRPPNSTDELILIINEHHIQKKHNRQSTQSRFIQNNKLEFIQQKTERPTI